MNTYKLSFTIDSSEDAEGVCSVEKTFEAESPGEALLLFLCHVSQSAQDLYANARGGHIQEDGLQPPELPGLHGIN